MATNIQVYFCVTRGVHGNVQATRTRAGYFDSTCHKGIDISDDAQPQLSAIARQLNERPRTTLGFKTPAEMFSAAVALTR